MIIHLTAQRYEFECEFEVELGEPATCMEPGWPDIYTLTRASVQGVDVTGIIDPAIVQELEGRAGWS